MVTRRDYVQEAVEAARSVIIELVRLLGEYKDHIVLVGGWVPQFLPLESDEAHVGSMDVDLALDHRALQEEGYRTIEKLLKGRGYEQDRSDPFIFHRKVAVDDRKIRVEVDLLAGEYEGTSEGHRHQRVQGLRARKARGCDLAFDSPIEVVIDGQLPEGGKTSVTLRVASIVPFLVMKGMALEGRLKEKDAYDVYYCIRNYPGGLDALVERFRPYVENALVEEGLRKVAKHFDSVEQDGPMSVANFMELSDPEERALLRRDAHEIVRRFTGELGVV